MKRHIAAALLLAASIGLSWVQAKPAPEDKMPVLMARLAVEAGESVDSHNTAVVEVSPALVPEGALRELPESAEAVCRIGANSMLTADLLRPADGAPQPGSARTALRLAPEQALCWRLETDEEIRVVFVGDDRRISDLGAFTVKGFYNRQMEAGGEAVYLLIEGEKSRIYEILRCRGLGNLEIVKIF